MLSQWNGSYMLFFLKLRFVQPLANMQTNKVLSAFKESKHTLTHQREYMSKGICVWENLWMCVWGRGNLYGLCAFARASVSQTYRFYWCAREPLSLRVHGLYIWLCTVCLLRVQKYKSDRSSVGVSALNNTEKALACDQSCKISQGNITG